MTNKKTTVKLILLIILAVLLITGVVAFMPTILRLVGYSLWVLLPFILAYIVSLVVNPMADGLQKRFHLPRGICAILVMVLTVGVIGGIVTGIVWKIIDELKSIYDNFPTIYVNIRTTWRTINDNLANTISFLPENVQGVLNDFSEQIISWFSDIVKNTSIVESAGNVAKKLPSIFISIIVFLIALYFMVSDSKTVTAAVKKPFNNAFLERISRLKGEVRRYVGGYIKAQLTIMCISFVILLVGLNILGVEYALIIALGIAVVDALPFFGSGAILWPWSIISFISSDVKSGVGLLIIYFSVLLMRQMVEPKIIGKNIGMHPLLTLMSMYIGYRIFSIGGMILGPLLLMFIISLYKVGLFDDIISLIKNIFVKIKREINNIKISLNNKGE